MTRLQELSNYRRQALAIANEFRYPERVIDKIKRAENVIQISNAMREGRLGLD